MVRTTAISSLRKVLVGPWLKAELQKELDQLVSEYLAAAPIRRKEIIKAIIDITLLLDEEDR